MQPERRKHVRILTIANFGRAMLVLVVILAAANIISEMRKPRPGEFGRLTLDSKPVTIKHPEPVTETEIPDITPTGPTTSLVTEAQVTPPAQQPEPQRPVVSDHVTIVGGADGIHVETSRPNTTPKLSGGIFRQ